MDPLLEFTLLLALLVGLECAHWITRQGAAFSKAARRYRQQSGSALFGHERAGFAWAYPLPPLGAFFVHEAPPFALGQNAVYWPLLDRELSYAELARVRADGRHLRWEALELAECSSAQAAESWSQWLRQHSTASDAQRQRLARELFDPERLRAHLAQLWPQRQRLLPWLHLQFALLFVAPWILSLSVGLTSSWPYWVAACLLTHAWSVRQFVRAHRQLFPERRAERRVKAIAFACSPPATLRACDALSRDLVPCLHPLAAASVLLDPPDFRQRAAQAWRELRYPAPRQAARASLEWNALLEAQQARLMSRSGLDPASAEAAPARLALDCQAYCPRCQRQFTHAAGACEACGGVELRAYPRENSAA